MTDVAVRQFTIVNRRGLHARAAAQFVKLAGEFDAEITVAKDGSGARPRGGRGNHGARAARRARIR